MAVQPTPGTLRFGVVINEYREAAKLTRADLARKFPITPTYIGRIIKGTTRCTLENAEKLDQILNANGEIIEAWNRYLANSDLPQALADYSQSEETSRRIQSVQIMYVDGLLQTESYARALVESERALKDRLDRQRIWSKEDPPTLWTIFDESVLYRQVGPKEVMREQWEYILARADERNVNVQIAPFTCFEGLSITSSFALATQADLTVVGFAEAAVGGGETIRSYEPLTRLMDKYDRLRSRALHVADTRALIRKAIEERWN